MADLAPALRADDLASAFVARWTAADHVAAAERSARWVIPFVFACVILTERTHIVLPTGGLGVLPLITILAPVAAIFAMWRYGIRRSLGFLEHPAFVVGVLPYLVLTAVLPVLGVMFHGYNERTLLSGTDGITATSFLILGAVVATSPRDAWGRWLLVGIVVELAYALGQASDWAIFPPFGEWDRSLAALVGQLGSLGRSTGLFVNPNDLGLWASVAAVLAWSLLPSPRRVAAVALALMTLVLSQSRGPTFGLLAAVVVGALLSLARGRLRPSTAVKAVLAFAGVGMLLGLALAFQVIDVPLERFGAVLQVTVQGPQADPNLAARLNLWSGALELNLVYPWGTWGAPELILGAAVDSLWFRALAQGSVFYVAALATLLVAAFAISGHARGDALRLMAVVVAVTAVTQNPLWAPVIPLFWLLIGASLQASITARHTASIGVVPSSTPPGQARTGLPAIKAPGDHALRRSN